jgi:hypothetical protein
MLRYGAAATLCLLGACSGNGGGGSDGAQRQDADEEQIDHVITESFTSDDPGKCTAFYTQGFLEQASGLRGKDAVKSCESTARLDNARSVETSDVSASDATANVNVAVTGSELDGQTLAVRLVTEGGQWKIDRLTGFVSFDRDALIAGVANSLRAVGAPAGARTCVVSRFENLSDQELQQLYLSFDKTELQRIIGSCSQKANLRRVS